MNRLEAKLKKLCEKHGCTYELNDDWSIHIAAPEGYGFDEELTCLCTPCYREDNAPRWQEAINDLENNIADLTKIKES